MSRIVGMRQGSGLVGPAARVHRAMDDVLRDRRARAADAEIRAWWEEEGCPEVLVLVSHHPASDRPFPFVSSPEYWFVSEFRVGEEGIERRYYDPTRAAPAPFNGLGYWLNHYAGGEA